MREYSRERKDTRKERDEFSSVLCFGPAYMLASFFYITQVERELSGLIRACSSSARRRSRACREEEKKKRAGEHNTRHAQKEQDCRTRREHERRENFGQGRREATASIIYTHEHIQTAIR